MNGLRRCLTGIRDSTSADLHVRCEPLRGEHTDGLIATFADPARRQRGVPRDGGGKASISCQDADQAITHILPTPQQVARG